MRKYNIVDLLSSLSGYRALPFPGGFVKDETRGYEAGAYEMGITAPIKSEFARNGTRLYKRDLLGRWYFMPVSFRHRMIRGTGLRARDRDSDADGRSTLEIGYAVMSITGAKKIVETELVGRAGSVKELVSLSDYQISITGFIQSGDGMWPEEEIERIQGLFGINESVELISALSDVVLGDENRVVIKSISYPPIAGVEDGIGLKIECVTDAPFELIID